MKQRLRNFENDNFATFKFPKELAAETRLSALEKNELLLYGEVDEEMAEYVREGLKLIRMRNPEGPITAYITSPGGAEIFGLEIHDLFLLDGNVHGFVIGHACSAASMFILQGCATRVASENAMLMCHNVSFIIPPLTRKEFEDPEWQMKIKRGFERSDKRALKILRNRTGRTIAEIKRLLKKEEDLSAEEALEFGLLDKVLEFVFQKTPKTKVSEKPEMKQS